MTTASTNPSLDEIRRAGQEALRHELGPVGVVRFFEQFITPSGDYTAERAELQRGTTMEDVFDSIAKLRATRQGKDSIRPRLRPDSGRSNVSDDTLRDASQDEIRRVGLEALRRELGPTGMIRFLQQFIEPSGDYTAERAALHAGVTVDDVFAAIEKLRAEREQAHDS
jgi:hypothetical protein